MQFFLSGEVDRTVSDAFGRLACDLARILNAELGERSYGSKIQTLAFLPIIHHPERDLGRPERRLVKHSEGVADYRLRIDYRTFVEGSDDDRQHALLTSMLVAVRDIDRKLAGQFKGDLLAADIQSLFPSLHSGIVGSGLAFCLAPLSSLQSFKRNHFPNGSTKAIGKTSSLFCLFECFAVYFKVWLHEDSSRAL